MRNVKILLRKGVLAKFVAEGERSHMVVDKPPLEEPARNRDSGLLMFAKGRSGVEVRVGLRLFWC